jgi:membrane-bound metal-dependent hydrolase YbcI (DUF457 family)
MFIGHFAVGFAARRAAPRVSLAVLFAAAQLADLVWPVLVGLGVETVRIEPGNTAFTPLAFVSYPWSHSLLMLAVWGLIFGGLVAPRRGGRPTVAIVAALVLSHWLLDVVTHRPDMPLYPGGPRFGFGLWNSVGATIAAELVLFAAGVWVYARSTRPLDRIGRWSFVAFVLFLLAVFAANLNTVPPSVTALWIAALIGSAILLAWSAWFDRHRVLRGIDHR